MGSAALGLVGREGDEGVEGKDLALEGEEGLGLV